MKYDLNRKHARVMGEPRGLRPSPNAPRKAHAAVKCKHVFSVNCECAFCYAMRASVQAATGTRSLGPLTVAETIGDDSPHDKRCKIPVRNAIGATHCDMHRDEENNSDTGGACEYADEGRSFMVRDIRRRRRPVKDACLNVLAPSFMPPTRADSAPLPRCKCGAIECDHKKNFTTPATVSAWFTGLDGLPLRVEGVK